MTHELMLSAANALQDNGIEVYRYRITGKEIVDGRFVNPEVFTALKECDGIILGSPTYMGGVAAQLKAFIDASSELWCKQVWSGKAAAGITCGSAQNGDQSGTLQYLITFASQHGMYWVSLDSAHGYKDSGVNRLGCQLGVVAQATSGNVEKADLATAAYLGKRVAELIKKLAQ
ncbi:MAG: flavodoxin family protein [Gammaproteobacteria bacterium]|nr:flavodoxin family protein [Gammaproteobacteria bacterium]MDH5653490.1 flavodoxin family protein [Gammaproteobacteria bacterium]